MQDAEEVSALSVGAATSCTQPSRGSVFSEREAVDATPIHARPPSMLQPETPQLGPTADSLLEMRGLDVTPTQIRCPLMQPETPQPIPFKLGAATSASAERVSVSFPVPCLLNSNPSPVWPTPVAPPRTVRRHLVLDAVEPPEASSVVESVGTSGDADLGKDVHSGNLQDYPSAGAVPPDRSYVEGGREDARADSAASLSSSPIPASDSTSDFERLLLNRSRGEQVGSRSCSLGRIAPASPLLLDMRSWVCRCM